MFFSQFKVVTANKHNKFKQPPSSALLMKNSKPSGDDSTTSASLGKAKLGSMILNK